MIEVEYTFGTVEIYCDNDECRQVHRFESLIDNYPCIPEVCKDAKDYGWIIFKEDGEWYHYCSKECKREDE